MPKFRPRRSALYMPGANVRALEKARTLATDCLILDMEDAVAPESKNMARDNISAALKTGGYGRREVVVRINALDSPWGNDDMAMLAALPDAARPDAICVPKPASRADIESALSYGGEDLWAQCALWAMVETPLAILNIAELAACAGDTPLQCLVMGTNDLSKELRASPGTDRAPLLTALSMALLAARHNGLCILDGVYNDIDDEAGLAAECWQGAQMGFDGKTLIHPRQIAPCNRAFAPLAAEIAEARAIVAAFAAPEAAGAGVLRVDGKMVELLHRDRAAQKIALFEAIAASEESKESAESEQSS